MNGIKYSRVIQVLLISVMILSGCSSGDRISVPLKGSDSDLTFEKLSGRWDEAVPLGNGMLGALIWQRGESLRFSLDRADLWDLRPVAEFQGQEFSFDWVIEQVRKGDYGPVQRLFDLPFDRDPAPTRIPGGALEWECGDWGKVQSVRLYLQGAICEVTWESGRVLKTFVHATEPVGWFLLEGHAKTDQPPKLFPPPYMNQTSEGGAAAPGPEDMSKHDLRRLEYPPGRISSTEQSLNYSQTGWGGFSYEIAVRWQTQGDGTMVGAWSIGSKLPGRKEGIQAMRVVELSLDRGYETDLKSHLDWWQGFWGQASVSLPDRVLQRQYDREIYKFGAASRRGAPPISLQAVWTADNGKIPPWKGDFHHDLNTQLSYWPCYSGNRLEEGLAYLDWLWQIQPEARKFTGTYFGTSGLNVPGVTTLTGAPMGGWIQYSFSPTTAAWLGHHFYLHWRYSMDRDFLRQRAYPWIRDVAIHLEELSAVDESGARTLPLSSSPEINNNDISAWFAQMTNYDLALMRWTFQTAAELASELELKAGTSHWSGLLGECAPLAISPEHGGLMLARGLPWDTSHRHFSHAMAVHPLGLISWEHGKQAQKTIRATVSELERLGPDWWVGYSYSWLANLAARSRNGATAARALKTFAECFCLPNSFHVNGDQSKSGKSRFTYRPFTLEGNFAYAAAVHEMLIQSHGSEIVLFPAVPEQWQDVSFENLRCEGAFLVSAEMRQGEVEEVTVLAEKGGVFKLENPFGERAYRITGADISQQESASAIIELPMEAGQKIRIRAR